MRGVRDPSPDGALPPPQAAEGGTGPAETAGAQASRRLQLFMGARLLVGTLLLGGTLVIAVEGQGISTFTPQFLIILIGAIFVVSLVFSLWLLGTERRSPVAVTQVVFDLVLTCGLVYVTGGTRSAFIFLYGVAVLMAALVLGPRSARLTGLGAIALHATLVGALWLGVLPPPPDQDASLYQGTLGEIAYAAFLQLSGLALVTGLASNLSARLTAAGGQLRLAKANAATLAQLNDDIVRSLASGLVTTDLSGSIRSINATGQDMLGVEGPRVVGTSVSHWLPIQWDQAERSLRGDGEPIQRAEGTARRGDGSGFPAGYSVNRLINVDGSATGALIVFQDLTEITELRHAAARQERLAVLGRLSAGLAHEIRNPLSSISGSVELVRESQVLDGEDKRLLGIVLDEVERLADLVTTMLEVGRPRLPRRQLVDLRTTVADVADVARAGLCAASDISLREARPKAPVNAHVDPDQVRQVVWNLVKNAVQASPPHTTITLRTAHTEAGCPRLDVIDQGAGIDPQQQTKVYEMFHSERTHGAGIGLALVRQIVDAHGATIEVDSEAGQGARFSVTFSPPPASAPADADPGPLPA